MIPALISITIALIILLIIGITNNGDDLKGISVTGLILTAVFGWGFAASVISVSHKEEKANIIEILRGKHIVVVETTLDEKDPTIFKGNDIELITDSTTFYWRIGYNSYGGESEKKLKIK